MKGWYYSLKEVLNQIGLIIKQTLSTSNRNPVNRTPVPRRKNTAIRLHYNLPNEDGDRDWHIEGDQRRQARTTKEDYNCPHILGKLHCGVDLRHQQFLFYRKGNEKSWSMCRTWWLSQSCGNSGSAVFKLNISIPPARAKTSTTVVMNLKRKKPSYTKMKRSC